jgi:hypothetical protein
VGGVGGRALDPPLHFIMMLLVINRQLRHTVFRFELIAQDTRRRPAFMGHSGLLSFSIYLYLFSFNFHKSLSALQQNTTPLGSGSAQVTSFKRGSGPGQKPEVWLGHRASLTGSRDSRTMAVTQTNTVWSLIRDINGPGTMTTVRT